VAAGKVNLEEVRAVANRQAASGRRGTRKMRSVLADRSPGWVPTESMLERKFLDILDERGIPLPLKQRPFPGREELRHRVDFEDEGLPPIYELDGRRWHTRVEDFERDRKRDREASLKGRVVYRFTWWDLRDDPDEVAETVIQARKIQVIRPVA
jgi:hypothetical protein